MPRSKVLIICPLGLLTLFACGPDGLNDNSSPTGPTLAALSAQCGTECAITTDSRPFRASRSSPDSVAGTLFLAEVTVNGHKGAVVSLAVAADRSLIDAIPADARVLVTIDGKLQSFHLSRLTSSRPTLYQFETATTIRIRYDLSRGAVKLIPAGGVHLTQYTSSGEVVYSRRPWIRSRRSLAANVTASSSSCVIAAPLSHLCGTTVSVSPFSGETTGGEATFQSNPGTGASGPITITFSAAVPSVTVTIYDPTYAGNSATAYDASGNVLGRVDFVGTGIPGLDVPDTKTLTYSGIRRVDLIPAEADYVSYDASFEGTPGPQPCPASVLDGSPMVSSTYKSHDPAVRSVKHMGRDYAVPIGTPVYANEAGRVAHAQFGEGGSGWGIVIRSIDANSYFFHLSQLLVSKGDSVEGGQLIALSGNSGHVVSINGGNGAHLHFEQHLPGPIWDNTGHVPKGNEFEPCTVPGEHT
jgi:murein DD-endopeptidase MepM/ murein hydrolase activator NlpD